MSGGTSIYDQTRRALSDTVVRVVREHYARKQPSGERARLLQNFLEGVTVENERNIFGISVTRYYFSGALSVRFPENSTVSDALNFIKNACHQFDQESNNGALWKKESKLAQKILAAIQKVMTEERKWALIDAGERAARALAEKRQAEKRKNSDNRRRRLSILTGYPHASYSSQQYYSAPGTTPHWLLPYYDACHQVPSHISTPAYHRHDEADSSDPDNTETDTGGGIGLRYQDLSFLTHEEAYIPRYQASAPVKRATPFAQYGGGIGWSAEAPTTPIYGAVKFTNRDHRHRSGSKNEQKMRHSREIFHRK